MDAKVRKPRTPSGETDREKFLRLGKNRVNAALRAIRVIGNLSNRGNYDYTPKDVNTMFSALQKALNEAKAKFEGREPADKDFSF